MEEVSSNNIHWIKGWVWVPGGEIVLSSTEGIVISITGLRDGNPLTASWQAVSISSMLQKLANQILDGTDSL